MKNKRLAPVLTIVAIVFTIISLVLDFSGAGEQWDSFGENVDWLFLAYIILATASVGLLLAVFPMPNANYRQRIGVTVPIAFILINLYSFYQLIDYHYGLSEDVNYFVAKRDLKKGKVELLEAGQIISQESEKAIRAKDSIRKVFGFKLVNVGIYSNGLEQYNKAVEDYLEERNGEGWEQRMNAKFDSIDKADKQDNKKSGPLLSPQ